VVLLSAEGFEERRKRMVERLCWEGVIRSDSVKNAFLRVPREHFVLPRYRDEAYEDTPLPIPEGQTISAPHMCAIMCEALAIEPGNRLLEVGTGSGYHAALCSELVHPRREISNGIVLSIEINYKVAKFAKGNLGRAGYGALVHVVVADGSAGAPARAAFDRILVTAAAPKVLESLVLQLAPGGRMVIPVGRLFQDLKLVYKSRTGEVHVASLGGCVFVPLRGKHGF